MTDQPRRAHDCTPPPVVGPARIFALYANERNWLAFSRPHLPLAVPVVGTVGWQAFLVLADAAECCIVAVPRHPPAALLDNLQRFRNGHPGAALVLIAEGPLPPGAGKWGDVVRPPLRAERLWPAIQRATTRALLARAAMRFEQMPLVPHTLRRALATLCRATEPIRSVTELAHAVGCHRRTLWYHWQRASVWRGAVRLEDVVDWVLLLHAASSACQPIPRTAIPGALGIHRYTLRRILSDFAGLRLRDLAPDACPRIRDLFQAAILEPLQHRARSTEPG